MSEGGRAAVTDRLSASRNNVTYMRSGAMALPVGGVESRQRPLVPVHGALRLPVSALLPVGAQVGGAMVVQAALLVVQRRSLLQRLDSSAERER